MRSLGQMPQTDRMVNAGLSVWENEGGAPVQAESPISEELGRTRVPQAGILVPGTILVEAYTRLPYCFHVQDGSYPNAWRRVAYDLPFREMEAALSAAGWTFFSMATPIREMAFGFNRSRIVHAALARVIQGVMQQGCNSLEVDRVTMHSFLGLPYVRIAAHPRHIQKGMVFPGRQHPREIAGVEPAVTKKKWIF